MDISVSDNPPASGAVRTARRSVFAFFSLMGFGIGFWASNIPLVHDRTGVDAGGMGVALFLIALGAIVASPVMSWLVHRFGSRRLTPVSGLFFAFSLSLPVLASSGFELMAGAFCLGLAIGCMDVPLNVHAIEVEKAFARPTMSAFHGFYSLGGAAGATSGGLFAGFAAPVALAVLVSLALAAIGLAAGRGLLDRAEMETGARAKAAWRLNWAAISLGLLAALCFGIEGMVVDWSALYLATVKHLPQGTAAAGPALFMAMMAMARFGGDALVERVGHGVTLAVCGAGMLLGMAAALVAPHGLASAVAFGLVGLAAANVIPVLFSRAGRVPGIAPEAAIAFVAAIGYIGFLLSPPLVGAVAQVTDLSWGLSLGCAGSAVILLAGFRLGKSDRSARL